MFLFGVPGGVGFGQPKSPQAMMGMMMGMQAAMQGNEESDATPAIKSEDKHVSWTNVFIRRFFHGWFSCTKWS